jgi:hypothetical protein
VPDDGLAWEEVAAGGSKPQRGDNDDCEEGLAAYATDDIPEALVRPRADGQTGR